MRERRNPQNHQNQHPRTHKHQPLSSSDPSKQLDLEYLTIRDAITRSQYYSHTSKHIKIRLYGWLKKLDQIIANPTWKRNRNNYVKLIRLVCQCQTIVEPFNSLPPQGDVPKLSKHQVNHIIDEIERVVKTDRQQFKGQLEDSREKEVQIKPQQFWNQIKSQKELSKSNVQEESSLFLGRFTNLTEKYEDQPVGSQHTYDYSIGDDNKEPRFFNGYSDIKEKQNLSVSHKLKLSKNSTNSHKHIKIHEKAPKHLVVNLNTKVQKNEIPQNPAQTQSKSLNFFSQEDKQSRLQAFRDAHISIQLENQTLKTEMFDQDLSIHQPNATQELSQNSVDECEYTDQLSERCRIRDDIFSHDYFSWRTNEGSQAKDRQQSSKFLKKEQRETSFPRAETALEVSNELVTANKLSQFSDQLEIQEQTLGRQLRNMSLHSDNQSPSQFLANSTPKTNPNP